MKVSSLRFGEFVRSPAVYGGVVHPSNKCNYRKVSCSRRYAKRSLGMGMERRW